MHDLSEQIVALTEAATKQRGGPWNEDGVSCLEGGKMVGISLTCWQTFGELFNLITGVQRKHIRRGC